MAQVIVAIGEGGLSVSWSISSGITVDGLHNMWWYSAQIGWYMLCRGFVFRFTWVCYSWSLVAWLSGTSNDCAWRYCDLTWFGAACGNVAEQAELEVSTKQYVFIGLSLHDTLYHCIVNNKTSVRPISAPSICAQIACFLYCWYCALHKLLSHMHGKLPTLSDLLLFK